MNQTLGNTHKVLKICLPVGIGLKGVSKLLLSSDLLPGELKVFINWWVSWLWYHTS